MFIVNAKDSEMSYFPADMTADDIMEFEYEYGRWCDEVRGEGQFWAENAECQIVAELQRDEELV
jgi:hypothetical protein